MASFNLETISSAKTLKAKTISELAAYQTRQTGNNCSFHSISVGVQLLLNTQINPDSLANEVNQQWWRGRFMRIFPNWAVTPRMQVRIIDYLAKSRNLPIRGSFHYGTIAKCIQALSDQSCVPLITLIWLWGKAPPIYFGDTQKNYNLTSKAQGHTMVLAAYDPNHHSGDVLHTPWGFINSWRDDAQNLFWMTASDFETAWHFNFPRIGPNPLVLMQI